MLRILRRHQRDGEPVRARTTGAADPVDVVLRRRRELRDNAGMAAQGRGPGRGSVFGVARGSGVASRYEVTCRGAMSACGRSPQNGCPLSLHS